MPILEYFTKHPNSANLSYFGHMKVAFGHSFGTLVASIVFFIHGIFPFTFENTGGNIVNDITSAINQVEAVRNKKMI